MAGIMRSTTPTLRFNFNVVNVPDIVKAYLTIKQDETIITEKDLNEAVIYEKAIAWKLTQEETVKINKRRNLKIQCKYKTMDGLVSASPLYEVHALDILKEEVI